MPGTLWYRDKSILGAYPLTHYPGMDRLRQKLGSGIDLGFETASRDLDKIGVRGRNLDAGQEFGCGARIWMRGKNWDAGQELGSGAGVRSTAPKI